MKNITTVEKWERSALFTSANDNWKTPQKFYAELNKEFGFDYDPCPPDPTFDGLTTEWGSVNFCNPPYSQIDKWIRKGFAEWQLGKTVVFLIPSRTDTRWWHDCCMKATEIRFVKGRLKFEGAKHNAPFPSVVVVLRVNETKQPIQAHSVQEAKAEERERIQTEMEDKIYSTTKGRLAKRKRQRLLKRKRIKELREKKENRASKTR